MASVYKTQGQNAQRLLAINETLREKEDSARVALDGLKEARDEIERLQRRVNQHNEQMAEKDRAIQVRKPLSSNTARPHPHRRCSTDFK